MNTLSLPQATLVIAALCATLHVALAALVIQRRAAAGIDFLDGGDAALLKRMRAHGNFTETAPMALLLLLTLEVAGLPTAAVWTLGVALVASRVLHAWGLLVGKGLFGRVAGTLLGLVVLGAEAAACVWVFVR